MAATFRTILVIALSLLAVCSSAQKVSVTNCGNPDSAINITSINSIYITTSYVIFSVNYRINDDLPEEGEMYFFELSSPEGWADEYPLAEYIPSLQYGVEGSFAINVTRSSPITQFRIQAFQQEVSLFCTDITFTYYYTQSINQVKSQHHNVVTRKLSNARSQLAKKTQVKKHHPKSVVPSARDWTCPPGWNWGDPNCGGRSPLKKLHSSKHHPKSVVPSARDWTCPPGWNWGDPNCGGRSPLKKLHSSKLQH